MLLNEARNRTCFVERLGQQNTLCVRMMKKSKKEATDPLPPPKKKKTEADPAKAVSGTNWTESKPRMKIKGGSHIQIHQLHQYSVNNDNKQTNNLFL